MHCLEYDGKQKPQTTDALGTSWQHLSLPSPTAAMLTSFLFWEHSQHASGQAFTFTVSSVWDLVLSELSMSFSLLHSAFYWTITFSKKEDTPYGNCGLCQLRKVRTMFFRILCLFVQVMVGHNRNVCKMWRLTWSSSHPNAVKTGLITRYGCKFSHCCHLIGSGQSLCTQLFQPWAWTTEQQAIILGIENTVVNKALPSNSIYL